MQGVANQRTINAQSSYDYSVLQIKNPKNHQILGWQVAATEKGQDSSQTGTLAENPAYILQLSNKDENGNEVLNQFYKDNGIDPNNVDQIKFEVHQVDEEVDRIARKPLEDAWGKAFIGGAIESSIHGMLNPFNDYQDAKKNFGGAAQELNWALNQYAQAFGADNSYYKELLEKLDAIDLEHKNSVVLYIKDAVNKSAGGEHLDFDPSDAQMKAAGKAFDECFGDLSLGDAKKKGREMDKAFTKELGESITDKFFRIWSENKSTEEIINDLIKEFDVSTDKDIEKSDASTEKSKLGMLVNQKIARAGEDENSNQMAMLKRKLDKTSVGRGVDVEM